VEQALAMLARMMAPALRVAAALFGAASATFAQQGEETIVRVRSLVPFLQPSQQIAEPRMTALPGDSSAEAPNRLDYAVEAPPPLWLLGLLQQRHRAAIDAGRLSLELTRSTAKPNNEDDSARPGGSLMLRGRAVEVDAVGKELDAIAACVGRPIEVTAWRLPLADGNLPATSWDAPTLQQALQRTPPLWTARARTRSGGPLRLAQEQGIGFLRDLDVEVAKGDRKSVV